MRVQTKLIIQSALPVLLAATTAAVLFTSSRALDDVTLKLRTANDIVREVLKLNRATFRHLYEDNSELPQQWIDSHSQLAILMARQSVIRPEDQPLLDDIRLHISEMKTIFLEVLRRQEQETSGDGLMELKAKREIVERLWAITQSMAVNALTLAAVNQEHAVAIEARAQLSVIAMTSLVAIFIVISATALSQSINRSIRELLAATDGMAKGNLNQKVHIKSDDELRQLGESFNSMSREIAESHRKLEENLKQREELAKNLRETNMQLSDSLIRLRRAQTDIVQQERLRALKQISRGIIHDINDALMPISGISEFLMKNPGSVAGTEDFRGFMEGIYSQSQRIAAITRTLSSYFFQGAAEEPSKVNLHTFVSNILDECIVTRKGQDPSAGDAATEITINTPAELLSYPGALQDAVVPVIQNALEAMPNGGTLRITGTHAHGNLTLTVEDTGPGITADILERCREPFFSTKGKGHSGIGLATAQAAVNRVKGNLSIQSDSGNGTRVILTMQALHTAVEGSPIESSSASRVLSILLVDDEEWVTSVLRMHLENAGHSIQIASRGKMALETIKQRPVDLVILDRAMPDMNGDEVAAVISDKYPQVKIIMLTGFGEFMVETGEIPRGVSQVLSKPVTAVEILETIGKVCG